MAKKKFPLNLVSDSVSDGPPGSYPKSFKRDGIDTSKPMTGAMQNALVIERPITVFKNSITHEPMDKPDYFSEV
ncbi:MAG: hypothetical protein ACREJN_21295 [Nitrospiraceae bacterium]